MDPAGLPLLRELLSILQKDTRVLEQTSYDAAVAGLLRRIWDSCLKHIRSFGIVQGRLTIDGARYDADLCKIVAEPPPNCRGRVVITMSFPEPGHLTHMCSFNCSSQDSDFKSMIRDTTSEQCRQLVVQCPSRNGVYEMLEMFLWSPYYKGDDSFHPVLIPVVCRVGDPEGHSVPEEPEPRQQFAETTANLVPGERYSRWVPCEEENLRGLPTFEVPTFLKKAYASHKLQESSDHTDAELRALSEIRNVLRRGLHRSNLKEFYAHLLFIEELEQNILITKYDIPSTFVQKVDNSPLVEVQLPTMDDNTRIILGQEAHVRKLKKNKLCKTTYQGFVHCFSENSMLLGMSSKFAVNRFRYRNMHRALCLVESCRLESMLFPLASHNHVSHGALKLFNQEIANNEEQMNAIRRILCAPIPSPPYVVFGPPGTGKTATIVEAIKQLCHLQRGHILACAPSNASADLLAQQLLKHIPAPKIFRFYAVSHARNDVPSELLPCSNWNQRFKVFGNVPLAQIQQYTVLICTFVTAGRLVTKRLPCHHITHVFLDESGQATVPEAFIPIAGILQNNNSAITGNLILAGDPKQLGPIVFSPLATRYGLGN